VAKRHARGFVAGVEPGEPEASVVPVFFVLGNLLVFGIDCGSGDGEREIER
jgi:hypothetical protein